MSRLLCWFGIHNLVSNHVYDIWYEGSYHGRTEFRRCTDCGKIWLGDLVDINEAVESYTAHEGLEPWDGKRIREEIKNLPWPWVVI